MSVDSIIDKRANKGDASAVEVEDFGQFLTNIWRLDATRPEIYQRKASAGPHWMHQLEPALQDKDPKR